MVAVSFFASSFLSSLRTGVATTASPNAQQSNVNFIGDRSVALPMRNATSSFGIGPSACASPARTVRRFLRRFQPMVFLQRLDVHLASLERTNPIRARLGCTQRGHDRNLLGQRGIPNPDLVFTRNLPARRIDDEMDVPVHDHVEHVRTAFPDLMYLRHGHPRSVQGGPRPTRRDDLKSEINKFARDLEHARLV